MMMVGTQHIKQHADENLHSASRIMILLRQRKEKKLVLPLFPKSMYLLRFRYVRIYYDLIVDIITALL